MPLPTWCPDALPTSATLLCGYVSVLTPYQSLVMMLLSQNRTELALNGIQAAKDAGVGFLAVVSVSTSGADTVFGRQFGPIEEATKASGLPYVLFRLPFFTDNLWCVACVGSLSLTVARAVVHHEFSFVPGALLQGPIGDHQRTRWNLRTSQT